MQKSCSHLQSSITLRRFHKRKSCSHVMAIPQASIAAQTPTVINARFSSKKRLLRAFPFPFQCTASILCILPFHAFVTPAWIVLECDGWKTNALTTRLCRSQWYAHSHKKRRRGGWGSGHPLFGSKRQKFGQIIYIFGHTSGEKPSQFQWRLFFLFFFLKNTLIWTEKPSQFQFRPFFLLFILENTLIWAEKPSQFWLRNQNSMHQVIFCAKVWCPPPNHFELLRPWICSSKMSYLNQMYEKKALDGYA